MPLAPLCPPSAPFFGFMGAAAALIFASARRGSTPARARAAASLFVGARALTT
jgi:hypothetical protein